MESSRIVAARSAQVQVSKHHCYRTMYNYVHSATAHKPAEHLDREIWYSPGHPNVADLPLVPSEDLRRGWARAAALIAMTIALASASNVGRQITLSGIAVVRISGATLSLRRSSVVSSCNSELFQALAARLIRDSSKPGGT